MAPIEAVVVLCNGLTDEQRAELVSIAPKLSAQGIDMQISFERNSGASDLEETTSQTTQSLTDAGLHWDESLQASLSHFTIPNPNIALVVSHSHVADVRRAQATSECRLLVLGDKVEAEVKQDSGSYTQPTPISSLLKLLQIIPCSHKTYNRSLLVGYIFSANREAKLVKRGLLRLVDTDGLCFCPVDPDVPFDKQGPFDAILHKTSKGEGVSEVVQRAQQYCREAGVPIIDAVEAVEMVGDRSQLCHALSSLQQHPCGSCGTCVRGVKYAQVSSTEDIQGALDISGMSLPCLVKGNDGSGDQSAHAMALLCRPAGVDSLQVNMPACVQEFVDHDALVHKIYVIGEQVFTSQRKSIPNIRVLMAHSTAGSRVPDVVNFSSQKNVFASLFDGLTAEEAQPQPRDLDMGAVESAAGWMRDQLGLTLFGFDVLVDHHTGDHVVVDINYFPSFADVESAAVHMRTAIKGVITAAKSGRGIKRKEVENGCTANGNSHDHAAHKKCNAGE